MQFPSRKVVRLPDFDYSSENHYFITICTWQKRCIFGTNQKLNALGQIVRKETEALPSHYTGVGIDHFVVMPNHIHMILVLEGEKNPNISQVMALYKAGVSRKAKDLVPEGKLWQRSFYEHVIRNRSDYENIWNYIENNPLKWELDRFYMQTENR